MSKMQEDLKAANTIKQVLVVLGNYYDLDQNLGIATKMIVVTGLETLVKRLNIKKK
jgi:hypothetical protein